MHKKYIGDYTMIWTSLPINRRLKQGSCNYTLEFIDTMNNILTKKIIELEFFKNNGGNGKRKALPT